MILGVLSMSLRSSCVWYRWFALNRSFQNVGLTYHHLYREARSSIYPNM